MSVGACCLPTGTQLQVQQAQPRAFTPLRGQNPPWSTGQGAHGTHSPRQQWVVGRVGASTLPALWGMLGGTRHASPKPASLHRACMKRSPNPMGFPRQLLAVPRWLWRGHREPLASHPTPLPESTSTLPGAGILRRATRAFLPSPSSSSKIAKASNLPAGKAEGKEPLFCR